MVPNKNGVPKERKDLQGKIQGLHEAGLVSREQADILHHLRFLGNDAAHQLDTPSVWVAGAAIEILEHVLEQVYEQPMRAQLLADRLHPGQAPSLPRFSGVPPVQTPPAAPIAGEQTDQPEDDSDD